MLDEIQVETRSIKFYCSIITKIVVFALTFTFQGCTILSGDVIISHLAAYSKPKYVVFLVSSICHVYRFLFLNRYKYKTLSEYIKPNNLFVSIWFHQSNEHLANRYIANTRLLFALG